MVLETEEDRKQAHLFTLRIWLVNRDAPAFEWRGRLQNLHSGEVTFFKNWQEMIACLEENLNEQNNLLPSS